ncbi:hypothetical protein Godav_024616 [Gossypium davidsonii]|uniref:DUF7745 domain-containing protein n=1 Tax=Gossypium davidsonii TaxID=34287 RepID=A0A7J8TD44_GOSDV|nr:hypothetical protein [Gossypium davidsonii]
MANEFLDKVEDNAIARIWSEKGQLEKRDSLAKGYVSELWDYTRISVTQNNLQELREIWDRWNDETKQLIKQKGECKCIPWRNLRDLILVHPDMKKKVDVFALSIYELVIFPRALGHVDEAVDQLDKGVTPVPTILAKTFRSLNTCRRAGEGRFIEIVATPRRDDISKENWTAILQNLQEEDVEWRASWLIPDKILYRCGSFDWVLLLGIWGAVGYAHLFVLRQYGSRQFVPTTHGLAQCEFLYQEDNYKKKVKEISQAWNQAHKMKRLSVGSMTTPEYSEWRSKRVNDNIPELNSEGVRPMEEIKGKLCKIEEMKKRMEELEYALQGCGQRIEFLEGNEERWREQLYHSQNQIQDRDYIMGKAVSQIREVANYLQTMAIQANVLSTKYELESDRGQELASLLKEVKTLSIKAKPYL